MPKVALNAPAPDFTLDTFDGQSINLADYKEDKHVLLIFNRGFV